MSSCEKYMEMASACLDGELSPEERAELLAHLEACPGCRAFYEAISGISDDMEVVEAPEGFAKGVMDALGERPSNKKRCKRRGKIVARVAALAACLALVIAAGAKLAMPVSEKDSANGEPARFSATGADNDIEERELEDGALPESVAGPAESSYSTDAKAVTIEHGGAVIHMTDAADIEELVNVLTNASDASSTPDGQPDCVVTFELEDGQYRVTVWDKDGKLVCSSDDGIWIAEGTSEALHQLLT